MLTGDPHEPVSPEPRSIGASRVADWQVAVGMGVAALVVVGLLFLISRNADSAGSNSPRALPIPNVSADEGCQNFGTYWVQESGVKIDPGVVEGLTNCRLAADGQWFVPTGIDDPRLPADFALTVDEQAAIAATRDELMAQIADLESRITSSVQRDLDGIHDQEVQPVIGSIKDGVGITRARSRYTRVAQSFLMDPANATLAGYVGWMMHTKIAAYERLRDTCVTDPNVAYLQTVCRGLEDSLSVWFPPFTWDLRDPVSIEAYLAYLLRSQGDANGG